MTRQLIASRGRSLLTAALIVATSCLGDRNTPSAPSMSGPTGFGLRPLISDGAHNAGTAGFFFLPPMVANPHESGPFDYDIAAINPVIAICDVTAGPDVACGAGTPGSTPAVRIFTSTSSPAIAVDAEKYKLNWDTGEEGFVAGRTYRVHVFAGLDRRHLGFADVLLTGKPGQVKNHDNQLIVLKDGRTLPIHFRIEQGVVPRVGPAKTLQLTGIPTSLASGAIASVTVTAHDENGLVASGYRGTVVFTSSDENATLPAAYTFTEADAGTHTFPNAVALIRAGAATVRATDDADPAIFGEAPVTVLPLAASRLQLDGLVDPSESGVVNTITVTARDPNGNIATGYLGTIHFTSTDPQAILPGDYTFTAADAGVHEFPASVTLRTAGAQTVRAQDLADAAVFGEAPITILAAGVATLQIAGLNATVEAGAVNSITVSARDPSGNVATGYTGTISFTSTDPIAALPPTYTFTAEDQGSRAFPASVVLRTAGPITVTVTDDAAPAITGSQPVTVTPAAAATLTLAGVQPTSTAGVAYPLTVTAKDIFGNVATGYAGTIHFSATDPQATVPADYTFVPADAGVRAFPAGVTFKTAAPATLTVADVAASTLTATAPTTVIAAAASRLAFTVQPSDAIAQEVIAPPVVVTAFDPFGNQATSFTGLVSVGVPGATLFGDAEVNAVLGVATFDDLAIGDAATGLVMNASSAGLTGATSEPFDIIAPTPVEAHWINPAGGSWSVGSNWSTGLPPTLDQKAFIDLPGTYTVTLDINATVNALVLGASSGTQTLGIDTRTLSALTTTSILSAGRLNLRTATLNSGGGLAIASGSVVTVTLSGTINAPVVNAGTIQVGSGSFFGFLSLNGAFTTIAGSLVRVQAGGSNNSEMVFSGGFTNHGTIEMTKVLDVFGFAAITVSSGTLVNATDGTITAAAGTGGTRSINAALDNRGTLNVLAPTTVARAGATHLNSGTIAVSGANFAITQSGAGASFTNTGTVSVAAGRTFTVGGGVSSFTQAAGATISGAGVMTLNNQNPAVFGSAPQLSAISMISSVANFAVDASTETMGTLTLTNSTLNGSTGVTITNAVGRTMTLSLQTTINVALSNAGTLAVGAPPAFSQAAINGSFSALAGSLLRMTAGGSNSSQLTFANGFVNHGRIEMTKTSDVFGGTILAVNAGPLVNETDGTIVALPGSGGSRDIGAQLDNRGTITLAIGATINKASADHVNSGIIEITGGNLGLAQSGTTPTFTNMPGGTITVAVGRTWAINGGTLTHSAGATLTGGGTLSLTSTNGVFQDAFALGALTMSNSVAGLAADLSTANTTLSLTASVINGPVTITNAPGRTITMSQTSAINTALVNGGTLASGVPPAFSTSNLNGVLTTLPGSLIRVTAGGSNNAILNVANGFTNHGTIELTKSLDNIGTTTFAVTNGTLVNESDGIITSSVGSGGNRGLNAELDNRGTVNLPHLLVITRGNAAHKNSGSMNLTGGDVTINHSGLAASFTNTGTISLGAGRSWVNQGGTGSFTNGAGGSVAGAGTFVTNAGTPLANSGSITAGLVRVAGALTSDAAGGFAPTTTEFFGTLATMPVGPGFAYTNIRTTTTSPAIAFAASYDLPGTLTVAGTSNFSLGALQIGVGELVTQNSGLVTMQNAAGVLTVAGNATFGGGNNNTRLAAGTLRVGGNFAQAGNSAAFAASGSHLTILNGAGAQSVSFANPGTPTTQSHFQRLEIANSSAAGVTINSAVFANGQLRTPAGSTARNVHSSAGQTLQAGGLDAGGLVLDNTPLRIVTGEALTRFDDGVFRNMNPAATQFRLDRLNDMVTFNNVHFETAPTTGFYMHLVDTDLAAPLFTVTMNGTQPANHGGRIMESVAGQLVGWPF